MVDMGVKPFLVSSSVRAIMAQRLVRKICPKCKVEYKPTDGEIRALRITDDSMDSAVFFKGAGCSNCNGSGYRGRGGIFEVFIIDDEVRRMITEKVPSTVLRKRARELGMRTLREDGIRKVLSGYTSSTEVVAVSMADED
jgi:general secretion pathway protein E/type IV pilus assembly protein PilB